MNAILHVILQIAVHIETHTVGSFITELLQFLRIAGLRMSLTAVTHTFDIIARNVGIMHDKIVGSIVQTTVQGSAEKSVHFSK